MSSLDHAVTGNALTFSMEEEKKAVRAALAEVGERIGRTIVKNGPLRVTMVALKPGGALREHHAEGPITVQVLEGAIDVEAAGKVHTLAAGTLFALGAGLAHTVTSRDGGIFLISVVAEPHEPPHSTTAQ